MDFDDIRELLEPIVPVSMKRMFGGIGIYAEGRFFALEAFGELYLKADGENRDEFEALGMKPFVYEKKAGEAMVMSYYALPAAAYDDEELRRRCVVSALAAARRAEAGKAAKVQGRAANARQKAQKKRPSKA